MTPDRLQEIRNPEAIQARLDNGATVTLSADGAVKAMCDLVTARDDIRWLLAALATAEAQLAECYRLSGADPDGNEDWRLAPRAVDAVRELRAELATAEAEGRRQGIIEGKESSILAALLLVEGEALEDPQPGTGDEAYQQAVTDCALAVRQLLPEEPRS